MASREEVAGIFDKWTERLDSSKVKDLNAAIQFDLGGDNGGTYWLRIADGQATAGEGQIEGAKMTLKATADDFFNMINGGLNPMQAFMMGKVKIQGDTGLALKLMPLITG